MPVGHPMTSAELTDLIQKGPTERLVDGLAPLTEKERKALSKGVIEMRKRHFAGGQSGLAWMVGDDPAVLRIKLALLAVGPWGEAQRIRVSQVAMFWNPKALTQDDLFRVLRDRKPEWLEKWALRELEGGTRDFPDWGFVRRLVRAGLCPRPTSDNYILRMQPFGLGYQGTLKEALLDDPELLDWEVWKLFEMNPTQGTIIWSADAEAGPRLGGRARVAGGGWQAGTPPTPRSIAGRLHPQFRSTQYRLVRSLPRTPRAERG